MGKKKKGKSFKKTEKSFSHNNRTKKRKRKTGNIIRNADLTPTKKLSENLKNVKEGYTPIVLLSTGSYNPIHNAHVKMFKLAKDHLEKTQKFNVIGCYISPSHDDWLKQKLSRQNKTHEVVSYKHRCKLIQNTIKSLMYEDWLWVDLAECQHDRFIGHTKVLYSLSQYLDELYPKSNIRCMYLCGKDLWIRCHGHVGLQKKHYGLVVLWRSDTQQTKESHYKIVEKQLSTKGEHLFIVKNKDKDLLDLSSTTIRNYSSSEEYDKITKDMLSKECVEYIKTHGLYKLKKN